MINSSEIWNCLKTHLSKNECITLQNIYKIIQKMIDLDSEDMEPESPNSNIPKWKRNIRNVLGNKRLSGHIIRAGKAKYKLSKLCD